MSKGTGDTWARATNCKTVHNSGNNFININSVVQSLADPNILKGFINFHIQANGEEVGPCTGFNRDIGICFQLVHHVGWYVGYDVYVAGLEGGNSSRSFRYNLEDGRIHVGRSHWGYLRGTTVIIVKPFHYNFLVQGCANKFKGASPNGIFCKVFRAMFFDIVLGYNLLVGQHPQEYGPGLLKGKENCIVIRLFHL